MVAFFKQPVASECCEDPCDRSSPCDPCEECPASICCVDLRGDSPDYSGTYTQNGTFDGSIAYEKSGGGAWFWRDWASFPENGWWVVSTTKGDYSDGVTQEETGIGGDACPNGDFWFAPLNGGSVVSGACS